MGSSNDAHLERSLEDTAQDITRLITGIPRKIDWEFDKHARNIEALWERIEDLESNHNHGVRETDERFERERLEMRSELSRNIATVRAEANYESEDEGFNSESSECCSPPPAPNYPTSLNEAMMMRKEMKLAEAKRKIASASERIFGKSLQVTARGHRHWLNDGTTTNIYVAVLTTARTPSGNRNVLEVGPPAESRTKAVRGLKDMLEEKYPADTFPPVSESESPSASSESPRVRQETPSESAGHLDSEPDSDPPSSATVRGNEFDHPVKGKSRST